MLKLKGQTESGEWVEFCLSDIETLLVRTTWFGDGSIKGVDPSTIRLADDPRKIECPFCGKSWIGFKYNADDPRKASDSQVSTLREQVKVLREACDLAKECLDNNGFGKAYVQSELYKALEQTNPKEGE